MSIELRFANYTKTLLLFQKNPFAVFSTSESINRETVNYMRVDESIIKLKAELVLW